MATSPENSSGFVPIVGVRKQSWNFAKTDCGERQGIAKDRYTKQVAVISYADRIDANLACVLLHACALAVIRQWNCTERG
ncbi:MAG: hypothetical protein RRZ24_04045 [Clostridia bacterium]